MNPTTPQIKAMQRASMGLPYEPRIQRADGTLVVEFFMSDGGPTWKICAITMAGGIEHDRHLRR